MKQNVENEEKLYTFPFFFMNILNLVVLTGNAMYNLYPIRLEDFEKTKSQIGLIIGIYFISGLLARFFMGPRIDRLGSRFFIRLGSVIFMISAIFYSFPIQSNLYLIFVRIFHGVGYGCYFTAIFSWVAYNAPKSRMAEAIGIYGISGLLTYSTGPLLATYILKSSQNNYSAFFTAALVMSFVGFIMTFWIKDRGEEPANVAASANLLEILKRPEILSVSLVAMIFGFGSGGVTAFIALYIRSLGFEDVTVFFTAYMIGAVSARVFLGRIADQSSRLVMIIPGLSVMAITQFFAYKAQSLNDFMILGLFMGLAHGLTFPAMNALMIDRVKPENKGAGTGLFLASIDLGNITGGIVLGIIAEKIGFAGMYSSSAIIILVGLFCFILPERYFISQEAVSKEVT